MPCIGCFFCVSGRLQSHKRVVEDGQRWRQLVVARSSVVPLRPSGSRDRLIRGCIHSEVESLSTTKQLPGLFGPGDISFIASTVVLPALKNEDDKEKRALAAEDGCSTDFLSFRLE